MITVYIILCFMLAVLFYWKFRNKSDNLPTGPKGLPIVGNIFQLASNPHLQLSNWAKTYGNIYTLNLGGTPALVVNDVKTMRQIFGTLVSTGRPEFEMQTIAYPIGCGLFSAEGTSWQEQQRFCLKTLKECGFGMGSRLETLAMEHCEYLSGWIDKQMKTAPNKSIELRNILLETTGNTMWSMITGEEISCGDSAVADILYDVIKNLNIGTKSGLAFIPWLKYVAPEKSGYNAYCKACANFHNLARTQVTKHLEARKNQKKNFKKQNSIIETYLNHVENCKDSNSQFYGTTGIKNTIFTIALLLLAGTETTMTTLNWLICYLVAFPNVQQNVQQELSKELGQNKDPSLSDKKKLPYLEAVVLETLRFCSYLPLGIIHKFIKEFQFQNYKLPKNMFLIANIYHANNDPKIWSDPEIFRPERFLEGCEAERKILRESLATFQEGKRKCPGEHVAKDTLFLYAAKLVQLYEFLPENRKQGNAYLKQEVGFTLSPPKFGVMIRKRTCK